MVLSQEAVFVSNEQNYGIDSHNDIINKVFSIENNFITFGSTYNSNIDSQSGDIKVFRGDSIIASMLVNLVSADGEENLDVTLNNGLVYNSALYAVGTTIRDNGERRSFIVKYSDYLNLDNPQFVFPFYNSISSLLISSNNNLIVAGDYDSNGGNWWGIRMYDFDFNLIRAKGRRRVNNDGDAFINHKTVNIFEVDNNELVLFGTAQHPTNEGIYDQHYSYYTRFDDTLGVVIETKSLNNNGAGGYHIIKDVIMADLSGVTRFYATGKQDEPGLANNAIPTCAYDINGNDIFEVNHNLGILEDGRSIYLTDDNHLLVCGRVKQLDPAYTDGDPPLYGEMGSDTNYNFFIQKKLSGTNDGAATEWTCSFGTNRNEVITDMVILDNKDIILVGNQQSHEGIDFADNEDLYLDQYIAKLNISDCTNELASNYSNLIANFDDGSCLYSQSLFDTDKSLIDSLEIQLDIAESDLSIALDSIYDLNNSISQTIITINIDSGWNMFGYTSWIENEGISNHMSPFDDKIEIMKDNWGAAYWPEYGFNGIGDFIPGEGYQLKAIEPFSISFGN